MEPEYAKLFLGARNLKLIVVHILSQDYSYSCKSCEVQVECLSKFIYYIISSFEGVSLSLSWS